MVILMEFSRADITGIRTNIGKLVYSLVKPPPDPLSMGKKQLFTADFEFHATPRLLFPYVHTASGLSEWFATDVDINPEKIFIFKWENEARKAVLDSWRMNHFAKFRFLPERPEDENDPAWFEVRMDTDDITQLTYVRISDYSDFDDMDELQDLWEGLIEKLKTVVGG